MRIAICDSDRAALRETKSVLERYLRERNCKAEVEMLVTAKELLARRADGCRYDLYLLETLQHKLDGIALGLAIREAQPDAPVVYVTGSAEGANASFAVSTIGYVLKPCDYDVFVTVLDKACRRLLARKRV